MQRGSPWEACKAINEECGWRDGIWHVGAFRQFPSLEYLPQRFQWEHLCTAVLSKLWVTSHRSRSVLTAYVLKQRKRCSTYHPLYRSI